MKRIFFYSVMLLLSVVATISCSKDDDEKATSATIQLVDISGNAIKGISVYAYDEDTWKVIGDDPLHADFQVVSNDAGNATFTNLDSGTQFTSLNNETNTFTFSAHYSVNSISKKKTISITLKKGDNKTEKLVLN
ncbi:MAG: hypothetical protein Q3983_04030 [Capnocytophaga sp.]|nr:hypothetical protein [Capnocytophaga sp.]